MIGRTEKRLDNQQVIRYIISPMGRRLSPWILAVCLLLSCSGCATTESRNSAQLSEAGADAGLTTLPVTANLRFEDLPVPVGFKLESNKSFIFQADNTRVALLKYTGRAKPQDLIEFYQTQMLQYNWNLLNVVEYDRSILSFERGKESCLVTIETKGAKKTVTISLAPKAKGSMEGKETSAKAGK